MVAIRRHFEFSSKYFLIIMIASIISLPTLLLPLPLIDPIVLWEPSLNPRKHIICDRYRHEDKTVRFGATLISFPTINARLRTSLSFLCDRARCNTLCRQRSLVIGSQRGKLNYVVFFGNALRGIFELQEAFRDNFFR